MSAHPVWPRYRRFLSTPPEVVVEWNDAPTGARGWLVLNSLRGGAAGGGTRMHAAVDREEVTYLAKAMELKFTFSGPDIGGGKSGIRFDPADPRRSQVLRRWFRAIHPFLASCYGTGGDVNVDEQRDVLPLCRDLGLEHCQQGVVVGHLQRRGGDVARAFDHLGRGLALTLANDPDLGVPGAELRVSDMITGYGVAAAARRYLDAGPRSMEGVRVVVEGFGNVGASAALYLARFGARIVGLVDADSALLAPDGLGPDELAELVRRRPGGRLLPEHPLRRSGDSARAAAYAVEADLMIPAAVSGSLDARRLDALAAAGVRWIVCGANQPFRESRLGDTRTQESVDERFGVMPDVVGSMGMARAFLHLMAGGAAARPHDVFDAVGGHMEDSVDRVVERAGHTGPGTLAAALELALDRTGFDGRGSARPATDQEVA